MASPRSSKNKDSELGAQDTESSLSNPRKEQAEERRAQGDLTSTETPPPFVQERVPDINSSQIRMNSYTSFIADPVGPTTVDGAGTMHIPGMHISNDATLQTNGEGDMDANTRTTEAEGDRETPFLAIVFDQQNNHADEARDRDLVLATVIPANEGSTAPQDAAAIPEVAVDLHQGAVEEHALDPHTNEMVSRHSRVPGSPGSTFNGEEGPANDPLGDENADAEIEEPNDNSTGGWNTDAEPNEWGQNPVVDGSGDNGWGPDNWNQNNQTEDDWNHDNPSQDDWNAQDGWAPNHHAENDGWDNDHGHDDWNGNHTDTPNCPICRDEFVEAKTITVGLCGHAWHAECLNENFSTALNDRDFFPPKCCSSDSIQLDFVEGYLDDQNAVLVSERWEEWSDKDPTFCQTVGCSGGYIRRDNIDEQWAYCTVCELQTCIECKAPHRAHPMPFVHPESMITQEDKELAEQEGWKLFQIPNMENWLNELMAATP